MESHGIAHPVTIRIITHSCAEGTMILDLVVEIDSVGFHALIGSFDRINSNSTEQCE